MHEYRETYQMIDDLYDYAVAKSEIDLRNIASRTIIPYSVYEENLEIINGNVNCYKNKNVDRASRIKAKEGVMQYTVSIPYNQYQKAFRHKLVLSYIHLDKYTVIPIVNYPYSKEIGLVLDGK